MSVNLVTGYAGKAHVTAQEQALFNAGICGFEKYVMQTNDKFACTVNSANSISISSGDLINQGRHINVPANTSVDLTVSTGRSGYHRIDTVVMRYSKDSLTGVESANLMILEGEAVVSSTQPIPASLTAGNLFNGDLIDDFPLYYLYIEDLSVAEVENVFQIMPTISSVWAVLYPVGSIYISVNPTNPANIFGGTWEAIQDCFLYAAGTTAAGKTGGKSSIALGVKNIPSHSHTVNAHTHSIAKHTHTASSTEAGAHTHGVYYRTDNTTGGSAQRVGSSGTNSGNHATSSAGKHKHTITVNSDGPTVTGSAAPTTNSIGSGEAFSIMPPYLTVYMWKRTS